MARAYTIWIVQAYGGCSTPLAAFTVKHELVTFLQGKTRGKLDELVVWRMRDGDKTAVPERIEAHTLL